MKHAYELMLVTKTTDAGKGDDAISTIKKFIKDQGNILTEKDYGKRALAYIIKKENEANYSLITMSLDAKALTLLNEKIRQDERILRHLLLHER